MKKLILLFMSVAVFSSCSTDDDGPIFTRVASKVVDHNLPEEFEMGKTYKIEVTYLLPDACSSPVGVQAERGENTGAKRREIYIVGVASQQVNYECTKEEDDQESLRKKASFDLVIDENEPYTFYLWTGVDEDDKSVFEEIEVPVLKPAPNPNS